MPGIQENHPSVKGGYRLQEGVVNAQTWWNIGYFTVGEPTLRSVS